MTRNIIRRAFAAQIDALGDDQVDVTISTGVKARDGDIWLTSGAKLAEFRKNPVVLFSHDPEKPVGTASNVRTAGDAIMARVTFAPLGVSRTADEVRGLVKSGVLSAISAGIIPLEVEPLNPSRPRDGVCITSFTLLEFSFVSIPANTDAMVTARALGSRTVVPAPADHPLFALAAELGEHMTPERVRKIEAEARRLGKTPEWHLRWLAAACGSSARNNAADDYQRRQAALRALGG